MSGNSDQPTVYPIRFYSYAVPAPGKSQMIATISPWTLIIATGIAADSKYLYVAGNSESGQGIGPQKEGVYRFDRMNLLGPPTQIASYPVTGSSTHVALVLDDIANPGFLYGRDKNGDIHVIIDPAGAAEYAGVISTLGTSRDRGMTYDPIEHVIYFIESESDPTSRLVRLE
jgi:hypothetical protein